MPEKAALAAFRAWTCPSSAAQICGSQATSIPDGLLHVHSLLSAGAGCLFSGSSGLKNFNGVRWERSGKPCETSHGLDNNQLGWCSPIAVRIAWRMTLRSLGGACKVPECPARCGRWQVAGLRIGGAEGQSTVQLPLVLLDFHVLVATSPLHLLSPKRLEQLCKAPSSSFVLISSVDRAHM